MLQLPRIALLGDEFLTITIVMKLCGLTLEWHPKYYPALQTNYQNGTENRFIQQSRWKFSGMLCMNRYRASCYIWLTSTMKLTKFKWLSELLPISNLCYINCCLLRFQAPVGVRVVYFINCEPANKAIHNLRMYRRMVSCGEANYTAFSHFLS